MSALRVLIIAGSAGIRGALAEIVAQDPGLEVMGTAADPFAGARRIEDEIPDAIILDTDTPRMDGLTFLRKLMAQYPLPVVIISSAIDVRVTGRDRHTGGGGNGCYQLAESRSSRAYSRLS